MCFCKSKRERVLKSDTLLDDNACLCASLSFYHRVNDAVDGVRLYDGFALAKIYSHEVPPEDHGRGISNLPQTGLFYIIRCSHSKYLDSLISSSLCCHLDATTRVSSHVTVSDDHCESQGLGGGGGTQHFLGHVGQGTVNEGALTQVPDSS